MTDSEIGFFRELREIFVKYGISEMRGEFWMGAGTLLISDSNKLVHPEDILITEKSIVSASR